MVCFPLSKLYLQSMAICGPNKKKAHSQYLPTKLITLSSTALSQPQTKPEKTSLILRLHKGHKQRGKKLQILKNRESIKKTRYLVLVIR